MGKQVLESIESRITDTIQKAQDDGYDGQTVAWYVTDRGLTDFQSCWSYYQFHRPHDAFQPIPPDTHGVIGGCFVFTDVNLKGAIAELRLRKGTGYAITLDLAAGEG